MGASEAIATHPTTRLRVASVCRLFPDSQDPSSGIFVRNRVQAMSRIMDVHALQPIPYFPGIRPLSQWAKRDGDPEIDRTPMFYLPGVMKALDGFWLARAVRKTLSSLNDTRRLDAIDAHFAYPEGVGCLSVARSLDVPLIITLRGVEAEQLKHPFIGGQIRSLLRNAHGCICVSGFLADLALQNGADESRLTVIHNAVDAETFHPGCRQKARARARLPQDRTIVTCVGHLIPRKRQDVLVRAIARLRKAVPDVLLNLVGVPADTQYVARIEQLIRELQLTDHVNMQGVLGPREVADHLRSADVFSLLSSREGCCNAVLESLACGVPVVTTPVGDNVRFVRHGTNGYIVPVDDESAAEVALLSALRGHQWNSLDIAGSLDIASWDAVAIRVRDFLNRMLQ